VTFFFFTAKKSGPTKKKKKTHGRGNFLLGFREIGGARVFDLRGGEKKGGGGTKGPPGRGGRNSYWGKKNFSRGPATAAFHSAEIQGLGAPAGRQSGGRGAIHICGKRGGAPGSSRGTQGSGFREGGGGRRAIGETGTHRGAEIRKQRGPAGRGGGGRALGQGKPPPPQSADCFGGAGAGRRKI